MAQALAAGGVAAGVLTESALVFGEPDSAQQEKLKSRFPSATVVVDGRDVLSGSQRVILAVKPQVLQTIAGELAPGVSQEHLLVSIAAGITLAQLQSLFGTNRIVRVMPNTPCQVGAGASAISSDKDATEGDLAWVLELMGAVGLAVQVPDRLIHAVTGVSGSSPAYVYLVIEALSDGGVAMGLPRETATKMAAQAVMGAAKMVLETGAHPGDLKDQVTSPGGTTIAALRALEAAGTRSAFIEAVRSAAERSEEMSR